MNDPPGKLAARVRDACARAAEEAYEDAGIQGLCAEGRWECALEAIRALDFESLLQPTRKTSVPETRDPVESP